ncbi:MAG: DNRLRE domain-containing protein [Chloroflexi bacterium]|nr:DNRLRE domain-containing protein [Chloroflexota bacterium]MBU1751749.1 DNRLRE domain-containing protein [Chloroflexota bacterium]MBU1878634.1 DNRLRE domain-containing protein [Chloroflexota bacterium]
MIHGSKIVVLVVLVALLTQCCPCWPTPLSGELTAKQKRVDWTPSGQSKREVGLGEYVNVGAGDNINVDAGGVALLRFPDLLSVEIYRDSDLTVRQVPVQDQSPLVILYLELGSIFASSQTDATARLRVETGSATVESLGTEFLVAVNWLTNATIVIVREGQVQVTGAGKSVTVNVNQTTQVKPGQAPLAPENVKPGTMEQWRELLQSEGVSSALFARSATLAPSDATFVRSTISTCPVDTSKLYVGQWTDPDCPFEARTLLRFDLGDIPADATVTEATLELGLDRAFGPNSSYTIVAYPLSQEWNLLTRRDALAVGDAAAKTAVGQQETAYSWDVTGLVQAWLQGKQPNYGLMLQGISENTGDVRVFDGEQGPAPPLLRITYQP